MHFIAARLANRIVPLLLLLLLACRGAERSFGISSDGRTLLKDGLPHRVLSGGLHYFRAPHETWDLRLRTLKASGVNAVQTYLAWNWHCPHEFEPCNFSGDRNVTHFLQLAQAHGLDVMLRAGPYICAEWDFGGFPAWILRENASIAVRSMDPRYLRYVARWYAVVMPLLRPLMYVNGGPVVMVQVENEYGSYGSDTTYIAYLRDLFRSYLGPDVLLYSTDGNAAWYVDRSATPGVYQAVDFGPGTNASASWVAQRTNMGKISPPGPPFNDEMYTGWLPQWFDPYVPDNSIASVTQETQDIMIASSNVSNMNFYMFFGGTNFGFMASYSVTTSYDYGAPMNETGHPTPKFAALRALFPSIGPLSHRLCSGDDSVPAPPPLENYGEVNFTHSAAIFAPEVVLAIAANVTIHRNVSVPPSMEQTGQAYGYIAYTVNLTEMFFPSPVPNVTSITCDPYDYAVLFIDGTHIGHLIRGKNTTVAVPPGLLSRSPSSLMVVVENTGRISFFSNHGPHTRGLFTPVFVNAVPVETFTVANLPMGATELRRVPWEAITAKAPSQPGVFLRGSLRIPAAARARGATMLDMRGFGKGFVVVNGRNLGRYWSIAGPQYSLHCPAEFLRFSEGGAGDDVDINDIVVFDQALAHTPQQLPVLTFSNVNFNTLKPSGENGRAKKHRHV
jgi:beta-galactosidase